MLNKTKLPDIDQYQAETTGIADHIPIVGHYNPDTLITKDGALVKTIEITGDGFIDFRDIDLRQYVSTAIADSVKTYEIAVYVHTIRSRKNIMPTSEYKQEFAANLNDKWCYKNNFDKQLINTTYVTFVYQGAIHNILDIKQNFLSLIWGKFKDHHKKNLDYALGILDETIKSFLQKAEKCAPRVLGLLENDDGIISEPLMFYWNLIHLENKKVYLPISDAADLIGQNKINFGGNEIVIDNSKNEQQFAGIFTLKDHYDVSTDTIDRLLQLGSQFVLTQIYIFSPKKLTDNAYKNCMDIYMFPQETNIKHVLGYDKLFQKSGTKVTDYCKVVTTLIVHSDERKFFTDKINQVSRVLHEIGFLYIREDFHMPRLFWANLPGNFKYLPNSRGIYMDSRCLASFASVFHNKSGNVTGSIWGSPVALLRTNAGTPFYFNFHNNNNNGSSIIIGPSNTGKSTIARFLITQSLKFSPKVFYFDFLGENQTYFDYLKAQIVDEEEIAQKYKVNGLDFLIANSDKSFLKEWLYDLLNLKPDLRERYQEILDTIISKLVENSSSEEIMEVLNALLEVANDTSLKTAFSKIINNQKSANYLEYNKKGQKFEFTSDLVYFKLNQLHSDKHLFNTYFGPFFLKLLIELKNDKSPKIFYINDFISLYQIELLGETLLEILDMIKRSNGILLATMQHEDAINTDTRFLKILEEFGSQIFTSDKSADKYFKRAYKLNEDELNLIKSYAPSRRTFLFKQSGLSIVLSLKLDELKEQLAILGSKNA